MFGLYDDNKDKGRVRQVSAADQSLIDTSVFVVFGSLVVLTSSQGAT